MNTWEAYTPDTPVKSLRSTETCRGFAPLLNPQPSRTFSLFPQQVTKYMSLLSLNDDGTTRDRTLNCFHVNIFRDRRRDGAPCMEPCAALLLT